MRIEFFKKNGSGNMTNQYQDKFSAINKTIEKIQRVTPMGVTTYFDATTVSIMISANPLISTYVRFDYDEIIKTRDVEQLILSKVSSTLRKYKPISYTDNVFNDYIDLMVQVQSSFESLADSIDFIAYLSGQAPH